MVHQFAAGKTPRRPRRPRRPRQPVTVLVVDPMVMSMAMRLAGGDASRLRINSDGSVLVVNRGRGER